MNTSNTIADVDKDTSIQGIEELLIIQLTFSNPLSPDPTNNCIYKRFEFGDHKIKSRRQGNIEILRIYLPKVMSMDMCNDSDVIKLFPKSEFELARGLKDIFGAEQMDLACYYRDYENMILFSTSDSDELDWQEMTPSETPNIFSY